MCTMRHFAILVLIATILLVGCTAPTLVPPTTTPVPPTATPVPPTATPIPPTPTSTSTATTPPTVTPTHTPEPTATNTPEPTATLTPNLAPTDTPPPTATPAPLGIGDTVQGNIWQITLISATKRDALPSIRSDRELPPLGEGETWVVVDARCKNISGRPDSDHFDTRFIQLVDNTGTTYTASAIGVDPSCGTVNGAFVGDIAPWVGKHGCRNPGAATHQYLDGWWAWETAVGGEVNAPSYAFIVPTCATGLYFKYVDQHTWREPVDSSALWLGW